MTRTDEPPTRSGDRDFACLSVEIEASGSSLRASVTGELELGAADRFEEVLERLAEDGVHDAVVDLRAVTFMDSTGLRMLLSADRIAREQGARLWIVPGGPPVRQVLEITGMDKVLPLVEQPPDLD